MAQNTHEHDHGHHGHNHENVDYGEMYKQPWVQAMVKQIQEALVTKAEWIGIDPRREQRVLDYACGHGTISLGVLQANPEATCRGIDLDASQVERYNDQAKNFGGGKMVAIQGDLYHPNAAMSGPEWSGAFDFAVISMALHHVSDPVDMLRRLKERLRPGGTLLVVEFLRKEERVAEEMVEVPGNQKIWPGFTTGNLEADMKSAGFEGFDVQVLDKPAYIPKSARGESFEEEQWCFFAKARVPEA